MDNLEKKIMDSLKDNEFLTISKLAEKVKEPRPKISACVELMEAQQLVERIPVASGFIIRKLKK